MSRRAVFLDRDGTLNVERDFVRDPDQLEILPGTVEALRDLRAAGFALPVITNQSGIARGMYDERELARIHRRIHRLLDYLPSGYFHCPHHPDAGDGPYRRICDCRKPEPGLILQAAEVLDLELEGSWIVGDSARDLIPGTALGLRTVLLRCGKPIELQRAALEAAGVTADHECDDLRAAAALILGD